MKRRQFMQIAGAGLAAPALTGLAGRPASAQEVSLRLHQFQPPHATIAAKILKPWAETLSAASDGGLKIQQFDAMSLGGKPMDLMDQAIDGVVDISMTMVGYTPNRFPRSEVFELPFISTTDTVATSLAYQQMIDESLQEEEFAGIRILGGFVHGPGVIHAARPVETLADMEGLKLRGPTRMTNALLKQLGATPIGLPLPAIPEALSKTVIDGTVIPWEVTPAVRLSELVHNHTEFASREALYTATIVVAMNEQKYQALPAELRQVLDAHSGMALSQLAGSELRKADAPGRAIAVEQGNDIVTLGDAEVSEWKAAAEPVLEAWVAEMEQRGIDGRATIERARALIAEKAA
ncbi:MAG: TRAP transporter substrate-binding protein [Pseudodonghicola sp.]